MNDFTASNGVRIVIDADGDYEFHGGDSVSYIPQGGRNEQAFREMVQAEADERLGRWRWPENPNYVVYPCSVRTRVRVLQETGTGDLEWVDQGDGRSYEFVHAARAYFDAHPEPKPWHDAKPSEVWEIVTASTGPNLYVVENTGKRFIHVERRLLALDVTASEIVTGRRIWPEVAS